jgi:hypothetical protein
MILSGKLSTQKKPVLMSFFFFTINPTWPVLGSNLRFHGRSLAATVIDSWCRREMHYYFHGAGSS